MLHRQHSSEISSAQQMQCRTNAARTCRSLPRLVLEEYWPAARTEQIYRMIRHYAGGSHCVFPCAACIGLQHARFSRLGCGDP